jgi:hypothetical protein
MFHFQSGYATAVSILKPLCGGLEAKPPPVRKWFKYPFELLESSPYFRQKPSGTENGHVHARYIFSRILIGASPLEG